MTLSIMERERQALENLRALMREQDAAKLRTPDRNKELERVWCVYGWQDWAEYRDPRGRMRVVELGTPRWVFYGFMRRRSRRKPQTFGRFFARVRRRLGIDKHTEVKLVDLNTASLTIRRSAAWRDILLFTPPHRQHAYQPLAVIEQPKIVPAPKARKTVYRKDRSVHFDRKQTKYIALGSMAGDRRPGATYLGPMASQTGPGAMTEARDRYPVHRDMQIVPVAALSKRLYNMVRKGTKIWKVRVLWPEPIGLDVLLSWSPTALAEFIGSAEFQRDITLAMQQTEKQLKDAIKREQDDVIAYVLAVRLFLESLV